MLSLAGSDDLAAPCGLLRFSPFSGKGLPATNGKEKATKPIVMVVMELANRVWIDFMVVSLSSFAELFHCSWGHSRHR